jgi:rare lipoprotein A
MTRSPLFQLAFLAGLAFAGQAQAADAPTRVSALDEPGAARADRTGPAAAYGADFDGRITASGERFDMYRLTGASNDLPLGAYVEVSNLATGQRAVIRINDRRPADAGHLVTLSYAAANRLGVDAASQVRVRYLGMTMPTETPTRYAQK